MPDRYLHGNGEHCPACALRRAANQPISAHRAARTACNTCDGSGRIAFTIAEVYARQLAEARQHYWSDKTYA